MKKCYHLRNKNSKGKENTNDLKREILYKDIVMDFRITKKVLSDKIKKVKGLLNTLKVSLPKQNINQFISQIYSSNGFSHLNINQKRVLRYYKYKSNVDYELIEEIMEKDKYKKLTLREIRSKYLEKTKCGKISITKLWSHIHQLGYKYVKLNTLNRKVLTKYSTENQKAVINFLIDKIIDQNLVFYVDECPLSKNIKKTKGFVKISTKINNAIGNERIKRTTLLYIIGNNGQYYYMITSEIITAQVFWKFINEAIASFMNSNNFIHKLNFNKVLIFMDNAPIHYKRDERCKNVDDRITILYNVPYCCHLNPVEYCFSFLKKHLKKFQIKNQEDLMDKSQNYLDEHAEDNIKSAIKYTLKIWENLFDY